MATAINLNVVQGSDFNISFIAVDDLGDVLDLTNHSLGGYVKNRYGDTDPLFDLSPTTDPEVKGQINISLKPGDTQKIPIGQHMYGVEVLSGDAVGFKVINGFVNVFPEVNN